jgi:hypothetical protein
MYNSICGGLDPNSGQLVPKLDNHNGRFGLVTSLTLMVFPPKGMTRLKSVSPWIHSRTTCRTYLLIHFQKRIDCKGTVLRAAVFQF